MNWTVFGDLQFIRDILNAVAGMSGDGTYLAAIQMAALFGVLITLVNAVLRGGSVPIVQSVLVVALLTSGMVSRTSVTVTNIYTGETAVVANVPMLVAVPGAVATSLGDELTTLAEAAFGIPGVTQDGYMAAVDRWRKVQMVAMSPGNYSKANDAGGGDFYYSWKNYLSECVVPGINLHHITQDTLFNTEFFQDAAKYESLALGSYINVGAGWVNLDCKDTYAALMTYTTDTFLPALKTEVLAPVLFDENVDDPAAPRSVTVMTTGMVNALGVGAIDQDKMIISIFTSQIYQPALAARMRLYRKPDVSVMIEDGIRRRNAQWIGQGSVFRETLMNVVVFLEGFFYGMVPFVVIIALLMGVAGLGLISKIFIAMLWVPLWPPILAFIHNYLINSLRGAILKINDVNGSIVSFAGGFAANDEIQKVLASAEMFAAYVPFIALFLLYGSLYSLNSVAGAISATDTVTENQAAPLQRDYAAVEYNAPRMVNDAAHGTRGSGTDAYFPQFTVSDTRGESTELAENRVAGARSSFSNSVRQALSSSQGSGLNTRNGFTFSERASSGTSEVYGFTQSDNFSDEVQAARDAGLSIQEASSVVAQTSLGVSSGAGPAAIQSSVAASIQGTSRQDTSAKQDAAHRLSNSVAQRLSESESLQAQFTDALATDVSRGWERTGFQTETLESSQSVQNSSERYADARRTLQNARTASSSSGASRTVSALALGEQIAQDGRAYHGMMNLLQFEDYEAEAREQTRSLIVSGHMPSGEAAAAVGALMVAQRKGAHAFISTALDSIGMTYEGRPDHSELARQGEVIPAPMRVSANMIPDRSLGPDAGISLDRPDLGALRENHSSRPANVGTAALEAAQPSAADNYAVALDQLENAMKNPPATSLSTISGSQAETALFFRENRDAIVNFGASALNILPGVDLPTNLNTTDRMIEANSPQAHAYRALEAAALTTTQASYYGMLRSNDVLGGITDTSLEKMKAAVASEAGGGRVGRMTAEALEMASQHHGPYGNYLLNSIADVRA